MHLHNVHAEANFHFRSLDYFKLGPFWEAEVAVVTFLDPDSAPVPKCLNPGLKKF